MKFSNQQPAYYRSLIFSCLALVFGGGLLWYLNRPRYLKFSTEGLGPTHVALELYYPADWTPTRVQDTYGWANTAVVFERRPQSGLNCWIDEHLFHISPQDWKGSTIRVQFMNYDRQPAPDIELEERRLRGVFDQMKRTGNEYTLSRTGFALGPALVVDFQNKRPTRPSGLNAYHSILIFPPRPQGVRSEVVVAYMAPDRINARYRQAAFEIINRMRLVEKK